MAQARQVGAEKSARTCGARAIRVLFTRAWSSGYRLLRGVLNLKLAAAFGAPSLGAALVVILDSTDSRNNSPTGLPSQSLPRNIKMTTKAAPSDGAPKTRPPH